MMKEFSGGLDFESVEARITKGLEEQGFAKAIPGLDLHMITAALLNGTRYDLVTTDQRKKAKAINFSFMYTPGAKWQVPPEEQLMRIYTDEQKSEIAKELGVEVKDLYPAIVKKFGGNQ